MTQITRTCDELEAVLSNPPPVVPGLAPSDEAAWMADWCGRVRALVALGDQFKWQVEKYHDNDDERARLIRRYMALRWSAFEACGGKTFLPEVAT